MKPYQAQNAGAIKMFMYRYGHVVPVYNRRTEGSNRLNKPETIFQHEGETLAKRYGTNSSELGLEVGEFNSESPKFIVPHDSVIEDDAHVIYKGKEYVLEAPVDKGAYIAFQSEKVAVLTQDNQNVTVLDEDGNEIETPING